MFPLTSWADLTIRPDNPKHGQALSACELNFREKIPIQTYLHHIYLHGVLSESDSDYLLTKYYVSLTIKEAPTGPADPPVSFDFYPFVGSGWVPEQEFYALDEWVVPVAPTRNRALVERAHAALTKGQFIILHLNAFFLKGNDNYLRRDFRYFTLLRSYAPENDSFGAVGVRCGELVRLEIPAKHLENAVYSRAGRKSGSFDNVRVSATTHPTVRKRQMNLPHILRHYHSFVASKPLQGAHEDTGNTYGANAYNVLANYFDACVQNRKVPDLRYTRLVWEKQNATRVRLKALAECGLTWASSLIPQIDEVEDALRALHIQSFDAEDTGRDSVDVSFLADYRRWLQRDVAIATEVFQKLGRSIAY